MNPNLQQQPPTGQVQQQSLWEKLLNLLMGRGALNQAAQQGSPPPQQTTPAQNSDPLYNQVQDYMRQKAIQDALQKSQVQKANPTK